MQKPCSRRFSKVWTTGADPHLRWGTVRKCSEPFTADQPGRVLHCAWRRTRIFRSRLSRAQPRARADAPRSEGGGHPPACLQSGASTDEVRAVPSRTRVVVSSSLIGRYIGLEQIAWRVAGLPDKPHYGSWIRGWLHRAGRKCERCC